MFHLGLQKVVPAEDYAALLRQFSRNALVQKFVRDWKSSPEAQQKAATMNSTAYEALAAEEALAMISEELAANDGIGSRKAPGLVKAVLSWMAGVADKMGFAQDFGNWMRGLTQTEAEKFVTQMVRAAMGGKNNLAKTQAKYGAQVSGQHDRVGRKGNVTGPTLCVAFTLALVRCCMPCSQLAACVHSCGYYRHPRIGPPAAQPGYALNCASTS